MIMTKMQRYNREGMTLMEIMVVIMIIGLLIAVVGPGIYTQYKKAQVKKAYIDLRGIKDAIQQYNMEVGSYPDSIKDLLRPPSDPEKARKWMGGIGGKDTYFGKKKKEPTDPWGKKYVYKREPFNDEPFTLYSHGPQGRKGKGKIHVWDLE